MNTKLKKLTISIVFLFFIGGLNISNAQDDCTNAPNIPIELYSTCGEMALQSVDLGDASPSTTAPAPSCAEFNSGSTNDLWYSFTVPSGVNEMAFHAFNSDYEPLFFGASKPGLAIYRGATCSDLTLINCFASEGTFMANQEIRWEIVPDLIPGETIWMRVWDEDNTDQQLFIAASVRLDMVEDNCDTPPEMGTGGCNILSTGGDVDAPSECGWGTSDNTIFYNFTVTAEDAQPYEITVQNGECQSNGGTGEDPEIQFAVYEWNGSDCSGIGGAGSSYMGCANGTGDVTFSGNLPPGDYVLAMDGLSSTYGNSLCTYGFSAPFIDLNLIVELNTSDAICGQGGSAAITVLESCSPSYEINWSNGSSGAQVDGLTQGSYSVTVTDNTEDCDTVIDFNIADEGNLVVDAIATGDICNGPFDAFAEVEGINPESCDFVWDTDPQQTTQEITDLTPGTYTVTVTYGACEATSSVDIDYSDLDIAIDYESIICAGVEEFATVEVLNGQGPYSYEWSTSETESSIPLDESGNYAVTVTDDFGCTQTDDFDVTIYPGIVVENFSDTVCDGTNANYQVEFDVFDTDGNPASFFVNGNPYTNSYSETFPTQTGYNLTVTDGNGCSSFEFIGVHDCECATNAGTMSSLEVLSLCQDDCSPDDIHDGNEFLDNNDVLQFILYEGTSPITILATNTTPEFCFNDADLTYGQIYYIAAIAGTDNGLGQPDPTDFCYTRSQPTPVVWRENPIAHIAHNELTTCGLEMTLNATEPSAGISGTWSANANFSPIQGSNIHDPNINVIVPDYGDVDFTWTLNNAGCVDSDQITVHFNQPPVTFAGNDTIVCGTEVEMNAILGTESMGQWSANGVSFNPSSDPNATATLNSGDYGTYICTWTETMAGCSDQDYVAITFLEAPQPNTVNNYDTICGTVYDLNVNNVNGDGMWRAYEDGTQVFPNFSPGNTNPQTTVTIPNYDGLFRDIEFVWTETNQSQGIQCIGEASVNVTFAKEPNAFVGVEGNQAEVCGNTFTFHADTTGTSWANGNWITDYGAVSYDDQTIPDAMVEITSPAVFGDSAYAEIPFQWAMTNTGCTDIDTMYVTFYREPIANAGLDDSVCGLQYQLEAFYNLPDTSNYNAFGYWTNPSGNPGSVNFNNTEDNNTLVNVGAPGPYEFVWRENNSNRPSCHSKDTVTITFIENPVIDAGDDFDVCGNVTTLSATTSGFELSWQPVSGVVFEDFTAATTGVQYGGYGPVTFTVGESNGMCTALDEITVTFWRRPSAEHFIAEDDTTVCGRIFPRLRAENPGDGVVGNWISDPANGVDFYEDDYIDTMEVLNYDYYTVWWTESTGPDNESPDFCTDTSEPFTIHFIEPPQANAGTDTIFCGYSGNMNAVLDVDNGISSGSWFAVSSNITFEEEENPESLVTSEVLTTNNPDYDNFELVWTEDNFGCTSSDTVVVGFARIPEANLTIIPPRCNGEAASIKAQEDSLQNYDWEFGSNYQIDSTWALNEQGGDYRHLVRWVNDDTAHIVSLTVENYWSCSSPTVTDTIYEPYKPQFEVVTYPDTCALGLGGFEFLPDTTTEFPSFSWFDTEGIEEPVPVGDTIFNVPAGTYDGTHQYRTYNNAWVTQYLELFGSEQCIDDFTFDIDTAGVVTADFIISTATDMSALVAPSAEVIFDNLSDGDDVRTSCTWYFGDGESTNSCDDQVIHVYTEPNECYEPYLVVRVRDLPECRDTAFLECITIDDMSKMEVPNIFTPNGDGMNDFFQVKAQTLQSFQGMVVNRWGRTIYEWSDYEIMEAGWNGKLEGGGDAAPGVYYYIIKAIGMDDVEYDLTGPFHLVREK